MPPILDDLNAFIEQLRSVSRADDQSAIQEFLDGIRPEDLAPALERMETDEVLVLLSAVDPALAADSLVELPTETARRVLNELPDETLAHYLDILPMDDAIDFREELGEERFDDLLELIPIEDAQEIRRLLGYPEDSAGRLMTERFFEVGPDTTMEQLLTDIRQASPEKYETVNDIYVITPERHLIGVFSLRKALRADPKTPAREIMSEEVVACQATEDAETAARQMAKYGFYALPVLDSRGRMVGIFTGDDAQTILREAETEDVLALGAVTGTAESYISLSSISIAKKRVVWLAILFVAENFTSTVMNHYAREGQIPPALIFVPLLIGAGGNAGSQTVTMVTRALALGEVTVNDTLRVVRKEFTTAVFVGAALGILGILRAFAWRTDPRLAMAIGLALPCLVVWATFVGSMLPLLAKRFKVDPAVMSAPFISTFVDATGLIIYFEIVKAFFDGRLGT